MGFNYFSQENDDFLEDDKSPYSTISDRPLLDDVSGLKKSMQLNGEIPQSPISNYEPNLAVKNHIASRTLASKPRTHGPEIPRPGQLSVDPEMQAYEEQQKVVDKQRHAMIGANQALAAGQIGAQLATGGQSQYKDSGAAAMTQRAGAEMLKGSEEDMDRRQKMMNAIEARKSRDTMHSENLAARAATEAGRREDRNLMRDISVSNKEDALAVPGWERTGEVRPKVEEAVNLRKATANSERLVQNLTELKELVKKHGAFEWSGPDGETMRNLSRDIQLTMKGPEMYNLGVLSGPDLKLLEQLTSDPSSAESFFTNNKTRIQQIDNQIRSIQSRLGSTAKSMGYKQTGPQPMAEVSDSPTAHKMTAQTERGGMQTKTTPDGVTWRKVQGGWEEVH